MTRSLATALLFVAALFMSTLTGCATSKLNTPYVFIYLKSGPNSGQGDKEARQKMFAGHMGNIKRLAEERKLLIAGPYDAPADKTLRGIFVMDVATAQEAAALAATDPGVIAGEFIAEAHEMKSTAALRKTYDLEQELQAELKAKPKDESAAANKMPPGLRKYTIVTTEHYDKTITVLHAAKQEKLIVWSGEFTDSARPRRGVLVLDCTTPGDLQATLGSAQCAIDGWWSTESLMRLER